MVMLRARQVTSVDEIVLCTTERPLDDELVEIAKRCGIKYYRGSLEDKLDRWLGATKAFGVDYFVTFDGDDLLCDPELICIAVEQMDRGGIDFIRAPKDLICGSFTYCVKSSALEKVCSIKDTNDTEMMWVYFEETGMFEVRDLAVKDRVFYNPEIRLTLDYPEDFEFFRRIFEHFNAVNNDVSLRDIVKFLDEDPEVTKINSFRQQDYLKNQKKKTKLVIKGAVS
jgi:spore coat polysaccharide biosynthesis protein SpsF